MIVFDIVKGLPTQFYDLFPSFDHDQLRSNLDADSFDEATNTMRFDLALVDPDDSQHPWAAHLFVPKDCCQEDDKIYASETPWWNTSDVIPAPGLHGLVLIDKNGEYFVDCCYDHNVGTFMTHEPISTMGDREVPVNNVFYFNCLDKSK